MTSISTYEKLYAFRKTKIYNQITSRQLFAYRANDKNIVYVDVFGAGIPHIGISLFRTKQDLRSYYALFGDYPNQDDEYIVYSTMSLLECSFSPKDMLPKQVYAEARQYLGKQTVLYPGLVAHNYMQASRAMEPEEESLCLEALDLVLWMAQEIHKDSSFLNHFRDCDPNEETPIPLFTKEQDGYSIESTIVSNPFVSFYPTLTLPSKEKIQLTRQKPKGNNSLNVTFRIMPDNEETYVPVTLICQNSRPQKTYAIPLLEKCPDPLSSILDNFCDFILQTGRPQSIVTESIGTHEMLKPFCEAIDVNIQWKTPLYTQKHN